MGTTTDGAPLMIEGGRQWVEFTRLEDDDSDFAKIGEAFAASGAERQSAVGAGIGRLMRARNLVDFGVGWMLENRR